MYRNRITHVLGESLSGTGMGTAERVMDGEADTTGVLKGHSPPDCPQVIHPVVGATGIEPVTLSLEG